MFRLMVQGDRGAEGIEDAVRQLGTLCKEREIGLNVGEAGQIVRILGETGAHVRVHQAKPKPPNVPEGCTNVEIVDCYDLAAGVWQELENLPIGGAHPEDVVLCDHLAWAIRLACLDASHGFIFFPGREGTLAHLVPIMAFIKKGEVDKGVTRPRRVALVGWSGPMIFALSTLFNVWPNTPGGEWISTFTIEEVAKAVTWLVDGLPAK